GRGLGDDADLDVLEQLGLRPRDVLDAAEQLQVDRSDGGDDSHVRAGNLSECADLAGTPHAHLRDDDVGVRLDAAQRQRQAELVVVTVLGGDDVRVRLQQGGEDVLRRRLPDRTGDRDDAGADAFARRAADGRHRGEVVVRDERRGGAVRAGVVEV